MWMQSYGTRMTDSNTWSSKQQKQKPNSINRNKNIQTELLIHGYCHRIQKLLKSFNYSIPLPIIELCLEFYEITEIINIAIGQCGVQIMQPFYKSILEEYNIDIETGKQHNNKDINKRSYVGNTYLRKDDYNRQSLRCILIDLEPGWGQTMASKVGPVMQSTDIWRFMNADNLCFGEYGTGNNWAKGHYTNGAELIDEAIDILRREIEEYEPQCIQFMHSIGGGTGSGMGTLMMEKAKDEYPDKKLISFTVFPSPKVSDVVVEPYNATLSIDRISKCCDGVFVIDNEALLNLSDNMFKMNQPQYKDINFICAQMINDVTSIFRYNDSYGFNIDSFLYDMVKYPNLKYFTCSRAPFYDQNYKIIDGESYDDTFVLTKRLFDKKRSYADDVKEGTNLSTIVLYRGFDIDNKEIVKTVQDVEDTKFEDDIISTVIKYKPLYVTESVAMIANSTSIKNIFNRINSQFAGLWKIKPFLHWYKGEGMDEIEFVEANKTIRDIVEQYIDKEEK